MFKIGDKVRIIKYGSLWKIHKSEYEFMCKYFNETPDYSDIYIEDESIIWKDTNKNLIGKEGVIRKVSESQPGFLQYALDGIPEKTAWYNHTQLELII